MRHEERRRGWPRCRCGFVAGDLHGLYEHFRTMDDETTTEVGR